MDYSDEEEFGDDDNYYNMDDDECDIEEELGLSKTDLEYYAYECLTTEATQRFLDESVEYLSNNLNITRALAKVMLNASAWSTQEILDLYQDKSQTVSELSRTQSTSQTSNSSTEYECSPPTRIPTPPAPYSQRLIHPHYRKVSGITHCLVCATTQASESFYDLPCYHAFCKVCWVSHFEVQISDGVSASIRCMATGCDVVVPEDLVLLLLPPQSPSRNRYLQLAFADYVRAHPQLRFCPGPNCTMIFRAKERPSAKRVTCTECDKTMCFKCGMDYHAPTDCTVMKEWMNKCADDSETANYISANTKDCPKCHICIEKNGGCNHMQCYKCKFDFCWMCLGDWKVHGSEYYDCSKYKENPNIANESVHAQAREALNRYLHYYERWENHARSLRLERLTLDRLAIMARVNQEVMLNRGTWIDWQYLFTAGALLAKCRYTLQYTYPFAYYMEPGPRKELFDYQQAQLEATIEDLSWKIENAESTDRGDLENQMDIAEKRRTTLLKDFIDL